jgi:hypothetical protein
LNFFNFNIVCFVSENVLASTPHLSSYLSVEKIPSPTDSRGSRNSQSKIIDNKSLKSTHSSKSTPSLKSTNRITPMSITYTPSFIRSSTLNDIKLMSEKSIIKMPNVDDIIMPVLPSSVENFKDYNG